MFFPPLESLFGTRCPGRAEDSLGTFSDMSKKLPRCARCGRIFRPDRYNMLRQECCTHPECVLDRKRQRQREWQARRRAEDADFRRKGNARCAAANRRRRAAFRARGSPGRVAPSPALLANVVTGLLSQLTDTSDPAQLHASLIDYAARGQRVALFAPTGPDPP